MIKNSDWGLSEMDKLPKDLIVEIMKKLKTSDIVSFSSTCKKYAVICSDDSIYESLWRWKLKGKYRTIYKGDSEFKIYKCYCRTMKKIRQLEGLRDVLLSIQSEF